MKILVYDHDIKNLDQCISILKLNNYNCLAADSYKTAIKYLHADSAILMIIAGVPMSNGDGFRFLQYLRNNLRFSHIHIIAMSAAGESEYVLKCRELEIKEFLIKPINRDLLMGRVNKVLESISGTILIAGQDETMLNILVKTIERENYKVLSAYSLPESFQIIKNERVDLVITDLDLPPSNGLEFMVQVKEFSPLLPVVLITGSAGFNREHAIQAGADGSIERPFHNIQIKRLLKSLIKPFSNKTTSLSLK